MSGKGEVVFIEDNVPRDGDPIRRGVEAAITFVIVRMTKEYAQHGAQS